ncbi:hypothetical protein Patl1_02317 [Pistacia atlantica]|uniref:Uncharacterized protein n=1 Tax=Pistacia atlantica TaxID=434234 RepID=A0ACC1C9W6_9ROSI|nr:hypothetical protein Patl1_02317 [Pistacia atlantica]
MEKMWKKWSSRVNEELNPGIDITVTVRGTLSKLGQSVNEADQRLVIPLSHGDPGALSSIRTSHTVEKAVVDALQSAKFNCCAQAMEIIVTVFAYPVANILLPRVGFPNYDARCAFSHLEVRHYDLLPEKGWEVDLDGVKAPADENTVGILTINPGSPCGNVFSYDHLKKIAETAKELGILVITDEVYGHLTFGSKSFVRVGVFAPIVPVITLGSISKRWAVTGWKLGWLLTCDPSGNLQKSKIADYLKACLNIISDPVTFIQVKLEVSFLQGIDDDVDFCFKLAKEVIRDCFARGDCGTEELATLRFCP